jgi:hypothetical protein
MSSVNKVILIGNLGKDPEFRRLNSDDQVVSFSVATSEIWRDKGHDHLAAQSTPSLPSQAAARSREQRNSPPAPVRSLLHGVSVHERLLHRHKGRLVSAA